MKKLVKMIISMTLCFTLIGMSGINNSYALNNNMPSIDERV